MSSVAAPLVRTAAEKRDRPPARAQLLKRLGCEARAVAFRVLAPGEPVTLEGKDKLLRGRDVAVPLVEMLEGWGRRSGSLWSTGVGARGRALLLLAEGNLDAAEDALQRALAAFDVRSHRYERARTMLVLAAVLRRSIH